MYGGHGKCTWNFSCKTSREDNIKINLKEIEQAGLDWIDLAEDRD
jgi:hypothetical protein